MLLALPSLIRTLSSCCYPAVRWPQAAPLALRHATLAPTPRASAPLACEGETWSSSPPCVVRGAAPSQGQLQGQATRTVRSPPRFSTCRPLLHTVIYLIIDLTICKWSPVGQRSMRVSKGDARTPCTESPLLCTEDSKCPLNTGLRRTQDAWRLGEAQSEYRVQVPSMAE